MSETNLIAKRKIERRALAAQCDFGLLSLRGLPWTSMGPGPGQENESPGVAGNGRIGCP